MKPLRDLSIRYKLVLIITLVSCAGLLFGSAAFVAYDLVSQKQELVHHMSGLAQIAGVSCTAPLLYLDEPTAEETLAALRMERSVIEACIYTLEGRPFARYHRSDSPRGDPPPIEPEGHRFENNRLVLYHPIIFDAVRVGTIRVVSDLDSLSERAWRFGRIVLVVLLISIAIVVVLSSGFQGWVTRPILSLARAAKEVSAGSDSSIVVDKRGNDEVGNLTEAFNQMIERVRSNEDELKKAHDELALRVATRTQQLEEETSSRQLVEEALREREEELRQVQRVEALGRLAGGVAHDFNNLLTAISGYGDLMNRNLDERDPHKSYIQEILKATDRAAGLTRQLLAFSRKQVLDPKVLDLNSILGNMEKILQRLIGEDVHFLFYPEPAIGRVKADPGQVEQVVMNLVVNARDAMPEGGTITVETSQVTLDGSYTLTRPYAEPGEYVCFTVSDNGSGIDEETRSHIFEPFFTTKEAGKGTGLGLSTVYGIVKQSGGHVEVESRVGYGTTFSIYLPQVDEEPQLIEKEEESSGSGRGEETILLVEDEILVRDLVKQVLHDRGYRVLDAPHGWEALLLSERHEGTIHMMVTDVVMPYMSGPDLYQRLAPLRPDLKVLYISGHMEDGIVHEGTLDPDIPFLQKPFSPAILAARVREILDDLDLAT